MISMVFCLGVELNVISCIFLTVPTFWPFCCIQSALFMLVVSVICPLISENTVNFCTVQTVFNH